MKLLEYNQTTGQQSDINKKLQLKFPGLVPVKKAPSLGTLNSFGISVYGKSNFDQETNTYTKSLAICALFIPIFYISAYRVADAPGGGWYFLGKEKLSNFSKNWNYVVLLIIFAFIGQLAYNQHITSPQYILKEKIVEAENIYRTGDTNKALQRYYAILDDGRFDFKSSQLAINNIYENDLLKLSPEAFKMAWQNMVDRVKTAKLFPNKVEFKKLGNKYFPRIKI